MADQSSPSIAERLFPGAFSRNTERVKAATERAAYEVYREALGVQVQKMTDYVRDATTPTASYNGVWGGVGFARAGGAKWAGGLSNPYGGTILDHWNLRQHVRGAIQDSPEAGIIINRTADSVVDSGLVLSAEPDVEALGITPEAGEAWARVVNSAFDRWARSKKQHRAQNYNFYQGQHLLSIGTERDNDGFLRYYYNADASLQNPLQFEIIDPNQVRGDAMTSTVLTGKFPDGIDRNPDGSERAYKIWVQDPATYQYNEVEIPRVGDKSGRLMMIHGFKPEYPGQGRGFSTLGAVVQELENQTDFKSSIIKRAINQSQFVGYVKPSKDKPSSNPMDAYANPAPGPGIVQAGPTGAGENPAIINTMGTGVKWTAVQEANFKTPGSVFLANLDAGEDLGTLQDSTQGQDFETFTTAFFSVLSAYAGVPYEVAVMKFSANYSASRGALLMFYRIVTMKRDRLADDYLTPTYEMWLAGEIAAGRISCPGWQDPRIRAAWLNCRWNGSPMPNIDPSMTADADTKYADLGAHTLDDIARNLNGSNGRSNRAKLIREFAERRAAGLRPFAVNYTVSESTSTALAPPGQSGPAKPEPVGAGAPKK